MKILMGRCQGRIATEVAVPQDGLQFREGFKDYHLGVNSTFIPILFYIWLQHGIYRDDDAALPVLDKIHSPDFPLTRTQKF